MGARRFPFAAAGLLTALCLLGFGQNATPPSNPSSSRSPSPSSLPAGSQTASQTTAPTSPADSDSSNPSSSKPVHEKIGANSSRTIRHTRVAEESGEMPELTQAEALIQKQNLPAAEPLLQKAVGIDPKNYEAWFDLGFVENGLGKVGESIAAYRKSVSAKPDVFESNLNLGLQLAKTGEPDAEQFLRAATQLKPVNHIAEGQYRAWLSLGHVLEKSNPDKALDAYRKAEELQANQAEPHLSSGQLLEQRAQYADAAEEYKKALALDPASDAVIGLANIYMKGRRFPEAEEYLRQLVKVHPEKAAAHVQLGRVLAAESKNDDAIAELQAGLKISPSDLSAQRDLAETYVTAGKTDAAEAAYRALVASHPQDADFHRALGRALLRGKKFPEAQQEFLTTVQLKPDLGEAYGDLAFAASENKNYPLTIKALDARAKFLPEISITYFWRASALDHLKDFKQAAANYRLFLKTAEGKYPDQEWQARHRLIAIEPKR